MRRRRRLIEGDGFRGRGPVPQLHPQMTAICAEGLSPHHLDLLAEEQWLSIPDAERRQRLDFLVQAWLQVGKGRRRLDPYRPREGVAVETVCRVGLEAF